MVSALDSESKSPGWRPLRGHCVELWGKIIHSHGASLRKGDEMGELKGQERLFEIDQGPV